MKTKEHPWHFRGFQVPTYMREGIRSYIEDHVIPGDFLTAIICNDLRGAVEYADDVNMANLPAYVNYFYNYAPAACWGSASNMAAWLAGATWKEEEETETDF